MEIFLNRPAFDVLAKIRKGDITLDECAELILYGFESSGKFMALWGIFFSDRALLIGLALFVFGILSRMMRAVNTLKK